MIKKSCNICEIKIKGCTNQKYCKKCSTLLCKLRDKENAMIQNERRLFFTKQVKKMTPEQLLETVGYL